jgi:RNA polymerase sigma-70 factor (ECF subfamily)
MSDSRETQKRGKGPRRAGHADRGSPNRESVESLVLKAMNGQPGAFDALYKRMYTSVSRLVHLMLQETDVAEDVTQDVFVTLWTRSSRFDPKRGDAAGWILSIARYAAIDRLRSIQAARQRDLKYSARLDTAVELPADEVVIGRFDRAVVRDALVVLTPKQRQSVALAFLGGHSYGEVASLLGIPLPTVKTRIRDGLSRLRLHLETNDRHSTARPT